MHDLYSSYLFIIVEYLLYIITKRLRGCLDSLINITKGLLIYVLEVWYLNLIICFFLIDFLTLKQVTLKK